MTKQKTTKRALLASAISLLLCFSMLLGTTYAWFTDSVTSAGNIIKSGTLDVTMEWKDATETGKQLAYKDASEGAIFNYDLWEPGYVEAKNIKISNVGTLALKYQLNIFANGTVSALADVIEVYFAEGEYTLKNRDMTELTPVGTLTEILAGMPANMSGDLDAETSDVVTIALKMKETAGNEYQDLSIGSEFTVQLLATQLAAEFDSFDNEYDVKATYLNQDAEGAWLITNLDELFYFASQVNAGNSYQGETVKLTADIDLAGYNWIPIGAGSVNGKWIGFNGIFDGQEHTISNLKVTKGGGWNGLFGLVGRGTTKVEESISNLTLKNVVIENANRMSGALVGQMYGNVENCHVENVTITAIPDETDSGYDNGDKIGGIVGWLGDNGNNHYIKNASAKNVTLKAYRDVGGITGYIGSSSVVENCTVDTVAITVDQSTNHYGYMAANAGAIVGRIYKEPVTVQNNTETGVTINAPFVATTADDLKAALEAGNEDVYLAAGTYTFPASSFKAGTTLYCSEGTVFEGTSSLNINGATVVGATFDAGTSARVASGTVNGVFKNCTFGGSSEGVRYCYAGETVVFENCVIKATFRGIHFDAGANDVLFKNCTISGFNAFGAALTKVTFEGCTFTKDESSYVGLNLYGDTELKNCHFEFTGTGSEFVDMEKSGKTLTVTNCTATQAGASIDLKTKIGGSQLPQCTLIIDGMTQ